MEVLLSALPCPKCQHLSRRAQRKRDSKLSSSSPALSTARSPQLADLQIEDSAREESCRSSKSSPSPAGSSSPVRRASWALASVVAPHSAEKRAQALQDNAQLDVGVDTRRESSSGIEQLEAKGLRGTYKRVRRKSKELLELLTDGTISVPPAQLQATVPDLNPAPQPQP